MIKKAWKDAVLSQLIAAFIISVIGAVYQKGLPTNIHIWEWVKSVFLFETPLWAICAFLIGMGLIRILARAFSIKPSTTEMPEFFDYNTDTFGHRNTRYTWSYEWNQGKGKFHIVNLQPACAACGTPMIVHTYWNDTATCSKCRLDGKPSEFHVFEKLEDVEQEILRRIKSKIIPVF